MWNIRRWTQGRSVMQQGKQAVEAEHIHTYFGKWEWKRFISIKPYFDGQNSYLQSICCSKTPKLFLMLDKKLYMLLFYIYEHFECIWKVSPLAYQTLLQLGEKKYVIKGEGTKQINYHCLSPVRVRLKSSSWQWFWPSPGVEALGSRSLEASWTTATTYRKYWTTQPRQMDDSGRETGSSQYAHICTHTWCPYL